MDSVKDKVVLITGASRGIGAATAVLFAQHGSRLVLTGRNQERLNKTVEQCVATRLDKDKILAMTGDVTVDADLDKLVESAITKFGTIHILVNNAAMATMQQKSIDDLDLEYRANLRAPIYLTKLAIPYLKQNKGSIVNVSSIASVSPKIDRPFYCIVKAGLDMFAKNLTLELAADGVRVNSIRPGPIQTPRFADIANVPEESEELQNLFKMMGKQTPLGRMGSAEECAQTILFLASDASAFTTGAFLNVDGGLGLTSAWTQPAQ